MRTFLTIALLAALAYPASAWHCTSYSTSDPNLTLHAPMVLEGLYVDTDSICSKCHLTIWIYEESNGIPGLQRGDEVVDDTCHDMIDGDTIVF